MVKPYRVVIPDSDNQAAPSTGWIMWLVLVKRLILKTVFMLDGGVITVAPQRLLKSYAEVSITTIIHILKYCKGSIHMGL